MDVFISGLLDLVFFIFDKHDNLIVLIPFAVLYFCFAFALIRRFMGRL